MDLPTEIQLKYMEWFPPRKLVALCRTSKYYAELCHDNMLWHKVWNRISWENKKYNRDRDYKQLSLFWDQLIDSIDKEAKEVVERTPADAYPASPGKVTLTDIKTALRIAIATKSAPILEDLFNNIELKENLEHYTAVYSLMPYYYMDLHNILFGIDMSEESLQLLKKHGLIFPEHMAQYLLFDDFNLNLFNKYKKVFKDDIDTIIFGEIQDILRKLRTGLEQDPSLIDDVKFRLKLAVKTLNIPEDTNELIQLNDAIRRHGH